MTYSPRNPSMFEPRRELIEVLDRIIQEAEASAEIDDLATVLADALIGEGTVNGAYYHRDAYSDTVYTTERMPRGFKVLVTIQPERNATILKGLELVNGKRYNVVVRIRGYRAEDKTQKWLGWTFFEKAGYGGGGFAKVKDRRRGPIRWPSEQDIVSIEEAPE